MTRHRVLGYGPDEVEDPAGAARRWLNSQRVPQVRIANHRSCRKDRRVESTNVFLAAKVEK